MRLRRRLRPALITAAAGVACLALGTPAWAEGNPPGANGTVKIDGPAYQLDNRNEPHVTCEFQVEFFNFDKDERADIILAAQPPSSRDFHEVGRLDNQLVSTDEAKGGSYTRDPDEVFKFSVDDLDLTNADLHDNQGYHIKLTVDRKNHPDWTEKHKVFWLKPCPPTSSPSSPPPSSPGNPPSSPGGNGGGSNGGGSLPITGVAAGGIALAGVALVGGGVALLVLRRRRDDVTFTA